MALSKPKVKLTGSNGNTLNLLALCTQALRRSGQADQAIELRDKVFEASSYEDALGIMQPELNRLIDAVVKSAIDYGYANECQPFSDDAFKSLQEARQALLTYIEKYQIVETK